MSDTASPRVRNSLFKKTLSPLSASFKKFKPLETSSPKEDLFPSSFDSTMFEEDHRDSVTSFSSLSSEDSNSRRLSKSARLVKPRSSLVDERCTVCSDLFQTDFNGEKILQMTCGHFCHLKCFCCMYEINSPDTFPYCCMCHTMSGPKNAQNLNSIIDLLLANSLSPSIDMDFSGFVMSHSEVPKPIYETPIDPLMKSVPEKKLNSKPAPLESHSPVEQVIVINSPEKSRDFEDLAFEEEISRPVVSVQTPVETHAPASRVSTVTCTPTSGLGFCKKSPNSTPTMVSFSKPAIMTSEPQALVQYDEELIEEMLRPKIKLVGEYSKITLSEDSESYELPIILNVTMDDFNVRNYRLNADEAKIEQESREQLSKYIIEHRLCHFASFDSTKISTETHHLIMFETMYMETGVGSEQFVLFEFYVFQNLLYVVHSEQQKFMGVVRYKEDIASLYQQDKNTLVLNLCSKDTPEMKIRSSNSLIITKWKNFFATQVQESVCISRAFNTIADFSDPENVINKKLQRSHLNTDIVPLAQMTSNSWNLILDKNLVPADVKHMYELHRANMELPVELLKKLVPTPEPSPLQLVVCVSLINNNANLSDKAYLENLQSMIADVSEQINPSIDSFALVYVHSEVTTDLFGVKHSKLKASYIITGLHSDTWDALRDTVNYFEIESYEPGLTESNLEQTLMFCEAVEKVMQFWDSSETSAVDKMNVTKNVAMFGTGTEKPKISNSLVSSEETFWTNKGHSKVHAKLDAIQKYFDKMIRDYQVNLHMICVQKKMDPDYVKLMSVISRACARNSNLCANFVKLNELSDFNPTQFCKNDLKSVVVPSLRVDITSLKKDIVSLCVDELENNAINLMDWTDENDSERKQAGANRSINSETEKVNASLSSEHPAAFEDGCGDSQDILSFYESDVTYSLNSFDDLMVEKANETLGVSDNSKSGKESQETQHSVFFKNIAPGYCKSVLLKAHIKLSPKFKSLVRNEAARGSIIEGAKCVGTPGFYHFPALQYNAKYNRGRIGTREVYLDLALSNLHGSIQSQSTFSTMSTAFSNSESVMELPILLVASESTKDVYFAKRQVELLVAQTLIKCTIQYSLDKSETSLNKIHKMIQSLVSHLYGMVRKCEPVQKDVRDFIVDQNMNYSSVNNEKYVDYLKFFLSNLDMMYSIGESDASCLGQEFVFSLLLQ